MFKIKSLLLFIPLFLTIFIITVNKGLKYFIDPLSLLYVLIFSFSLFGYSEGKSGFSLLFQLIFRGDNQNTAGKDRVLKSLENLLFYIYISGITALFAGQLMLLNLYPVHEFTTQKHFADSFLALLYSFILNEFLIRPVKNSLKE